jgi:hypothetical protein
MKPGVFFIPYKERERYAAAFLATLVLVTIGRGSDTRLLGYTTPVGL